MKIQVESNVLPVTVSINSVLATVVVSSEEGDTVRDVIQAAIDNTPGLAGKLTVEEILDRELSYADKSGQQRQVNGEDRVQGGGVLAAGTHHDNG